MYQIKVNRKHMKKWKVTQDNVLYFDNIEKNKGTLLTLDPKPYEDFLNEFGIFYTKTAC